MKQPVGQRDAPVCHIRCDSPRPSEAEQLGAQETPVGAETGGARIGSGAHLPDPGELLNPPGAPICKVWETGWSWESEPQIYRPAAALRGRLHS